MPKIWAIELYSSYTTGVRHWDPADVAAVVKDYADWLKHSAIPKLFINADPGVLVTGTSREFCRSWANQTEVTVKGLHFIQEDSPEEIGAALADFVKSLR
jgi:haloalkane dehalogenase